MATDTETTSSRGLPANENTFATSQEVPPDQLTENYSSVFASILASLRWSPTSKQELERAEDRLLSTIKQPKKTYFVDIGPGWDLDSNKIRTLEMTLDNKDEKKADEKIPLVMIHGFAAGIGCWILNLDKLSSTLDRRIYAIDVLGFARSSRPSFDLSEDVEAQFVQSIERWREVQGIDKFILLGHSFGGYLSANYALRYPERVPHVILADPWGVQDRQLSSNNRPSYRFPIWVRGINRIFQIFSPLAVLRATGPYGPRLVHRFRGDLKEKFRPILGDNCSWFLDYIYHCNAQKPTGELAFKSLTLPYGWPKNPLIHRLVVLDESVSMTFIYGARSFIERAPGEFLKDCLGPSRVTVNLIQASGHHVYADKFDEYNDLVKEACSKIEI